METESKRSSLIPFLLAGLVLLSTAGIVWWFPLLSCPIDPFTDYTDGGCTLCGGRRRITVVQHWRSKPLIAADWDGMKLNWIEGEGFQKTNFRHALDLAGVFGGLPFTNEMRLSAAKTLLATGCYSKVQVLARRANAATVQLRIVVEEAPGELHLPGEKW